MNFLEVENLRVSFPAHSSKLTVHAVDGVSLSVEEGESVGLVGESGCGKTTLANAIVGLVTPAGGRVLFRGSDARELSGAALRRFRAQVQMVFQDPFGSLNPRLSIGSALREVLVVHGMNRRRAEGDGRVGDLLRSVGLDAEHALRYPHELSGGQRQRVGIARALAVGPSLLVADEPVSALDVSVQVQILNLLRDLSRDRELSCLLIAHDLAVVRYTCARILVMYLGRIVESAPTEELFVRPCHPYTEALLSAVPDVEMGLRARAGGSRRIVLQGDAAFVGVRVTGCPFHPRCHRVLDVCRSVPPPAVAVAPGRMSLCHLAARLASGEAR